MVARRIRSDGRMGKLLEQKLFDHGVSNRKEWSDIQEFRPAFFSRAVYSLYEV